MQEGTINIGGEIIPAWIVENEVHVCVEKMISHKIILKYGVVNDKCTIYFGNVKTQTESEVICDCFCCDMEYTVTLI